MSDSVSIASMQSKYPASKPPQMSRGKKALNYTVTGAVATAAIMGLDHVAPKFTRRAVMFDFSSFKGKQIEPAFKSLSGKNKALFIAGSAVFAGLIGLITGGKKTKEQ